MNACYDSFRMDRSDRKVANALGKTASDAAPASATGSPAAPGSGVRRLASERRRARILEAARSCFGRLGFAGATVELIAGEAGVSNGLLYQFFRSKEELLGVVLQELVRDWARAMAAGEREASAAAALAAVFRGGVEFARGNPLLPKLLTDDAQLQLARFRLSSSDRVAPHRELVARILRRGVESGEFDPPLDVASTADVVCQLQVDYSARAYRRDPLHPAPPALVDAVIRFVLDAVRRKEPTAVSAAASPARR
jgi:AcrR family transcriptional regulator